MHIISIIEKIEESQVFKDWQKENDGFYLVHVFLMSEQLPQVGYYNDKLDKIVTFDLGEEVKINPLSDVFKEGKTITELRLKNVQIDTEDAKKIVDDFKQSNYSHELLQKEIMLLQEIEGTTVYNFTFFTKSFKTLNIKLNASDGKIISHDLTSLVSF